MPDDMHSSQQFVKLLGIMKNGIMGSINSTVSLSLQMSL